MVLPHQWSVRYVDRVPIEDQIRLRQRHLVERQFEGRGVYPSPSLRCLCCLNPDLDFVGEEGKGEQDEWNGQGVDSVFGVEVHFEVAGREGIEVQVERYIHHVESPRWEMVLQVIPTPECNYVVGGFEGKCSRD